MSMTIQSSAFADGQPIPVKFTGEGADVSPPLSKAQLLVAMSDHILATAEIVGTYERSSA